MINAINRWALERERQLIEHKLLRLGVLTKEVTVLERKKTESYWPKKIYYQLIYNKAKEELDELTEMKPTLEVRLDSIRRNQKT